MSDIHVIFAIRLRSNSTVVVLGDRVGRVLNCSFAASQHPEYPDQMIMEAEAACLRFRIIHRRSHADPKLRVYQLRGENVLEPRWAYGETIDLSEWMLQEFRKRDSSEWYIPTVEELKKEAGIK